MAVTTWASDHEGASSCILFGQPITARLCFFDADRETGPARVPAFMPTSDPSSKLPAAAPSPRSTLTSADN
ncbi:MAG: hypothetical protein M3178_12990 [Pseudomonadota bacterium]|nr:hypothetical protein [Pseudomonadota bacterium]